MAKAKTKSAAKKTAQEKVSENGSYDSGVRLNVQKTYKLYIGGKFPRTESGRFYTVNDTSGNFLGNICRGSRKDFRNSVRAARAAFAGWAGRTHYNRGQILYRIAEMLEGRSEQFVKELMDLGSSEKEARSEVAAAVDRCVYYAGWADKYQQVFSSVNPVSSSHFNFSVLEPTGVVSAFAPEENGLLGLVSTILPAICGGNTIIVLASHSKPTCSISFAEVLNSSDVPGGVVNILTGMRDELSGHFSTHMDVNAMVYCGELGAELKEIQLNATKNVKRVVHWEVKDWYAEEAQGPYYILDTQETKTTWHPIGI